MSHIERMKTELSDLSGKIEKLEEFIDGSEIYHTLANPQQALLNAQLGAMQAYASILAARVLLA